MYYKIIVDSSWGVPVWELHIWRWWFPFWIYSTAFKSQWDAHQYGREKQTKYNRYGEVVLEPTFNKNQLLRSMFSRIVVPIAMFSMIVFFLL